MRFLTPKLTILLSAIICTFCIGCEQVEEVKYQEVSKVPLSSDVELEVEEDKNKNLYIELDTTDWEEVEVVGIKSCKYSAKDGIIQIEYHNDSLEDVIIDVRKDGVNKDYKYLLNNGPQRKDIITLTEGTGDYRIRFLKKKNSTSYTLLHQFYIKMEEDTNTKYLVSTQQVPFEDSKHLQMLKDTLKSQQFTFKKSAVNYATGMVKYDTKKAEEVSGQTMFNYKLDIDETIENQKGICIDKSVLLASILRSEGIPTKVIHGYRGTEWHSWVEIYDDEKAQWQLIDPSIVLNAKRPNLEYNKYYTF